MRGLPLAAPAACACAPQLCTCVGEPAPARIIRPCCCSSPCAPPAAHMAAGVLARPLLHPSPPPSAGPPFPTPSPPLLPAAKVRCRWCFHCLCDLPTLPSAVADVDALVAAVRQCLGGGAGQAAGGGCSSSSSSTSHSSRGHGSKGNHYHSSSSSSSSKSGGVLMRLPYLEAQQGSATITAMKPWRHRM